MKKVLKKIMMLAVSALLIGSFAACSGDGDDDDYLSNGSQPENGGSGAFSWETAELIPSLAGKEYKWAGAKVKTDIASRLQVGSKVVFELEELDGLCKFRITKDWDKVCEGGISKYYSADGKEVKVKLADHADTYENDESKAGTYYFVVETGTLEALKKGFDIVGCFKLVKIGVTNLVAASEPEPEADINETVLLDTEYNTMGWGAATNIAADKFAGAKAGDKIVVTYKMNDDGQAGYHMFQLWNTLVDGDHTCFDEIKDLSADDSYTHTLTADEVALVKVNGLSIQGNSVTVTKVALKSVGAAVANETVLLDTEYNTMGWGTAANIAADKFANAKAGDKIVVTYKMNDDGQAGYHMFQLWNTPVDGEHTFFDEIKDLSADDSYTHTLTADEVALVKVNGLSIQGNSVTVTKVVLK
ncbi:hypothetical protein [uncultured Treponema sp.]|uniref:hypothetical protein n=1 Tax=uncultured Treponema sp. TaxID=162155 RepID=UPI0025E9343C|nr:hypothetical protein [uncultured Treponema sp.]